LFSNEKKLFEELNITSKSVKINTEPHDFYSYILHKFKSTINEYLIETPKEFEKNFIEKLESCVLNRSHLNKLIITFSYNVK
jgi:hypothetical protein